MKKLFIALLLTFSLTTFGQERSFTSLYPSDSVEQSNDMFQSSSGDFFMLGATTTAGSGGQDILLTKSDGLGNVLWSYAYGTSGEDVGLAIAPAIDGGILVAGYSDGLGTSSGEDVLILKISSTGLLSWGRSLRGNLDDRAHDIMQTSDGNIYITGFNDVDSLGLNIFLCKYSSTGSFFFNKSYGDIGDDIGNGIALGRNGNFLIVGSTENDSVNIGPTGDKDAMLIEVNSAGNVINSKNFGTMGDDEAVSVVSTIDYKHTILGNTQAGGGGMQDLFTFEVDTNFNTSNSFWFGGIGNEEGFNHVLTQNGDMLIGAAVDGLVSPRELMVLNTTRTGGVINLGIIGGPSQDGISRVTVSGFLSGSYAAYASGTSFSPSSTEDTYLVGIEDDLESNCQDINDIIAFGTFSLSSGSFDTSFSYGTSFSNLVARTTLTSFDSSRCCQLVASVSSDSIQICEGSSVGLGQPDISGYTYSWTESGSSWSSSLSNPFVSPSSNSTYQLIVTADSGSCSPDTASVFVGVDTLLDVTAIPDTFICEGDSIYLIGTSGFISYNWQVSAGAFGNDSVKISTQDTGILTLIDNNSCIYIDTVIIDLIPLPVFSLGNDTTICDNAPITLYGPTGMDDYKWNGTSGTVDSLVTASSQVHTLEVTSSFGCKYDDELQLLTNPSSPLSLGNDTTFCLGTTYTINAPGALTGFLWNDSFAVGANYSVTSAGTYWVEARNSLGCFSYDTITLTTLAEPVFSLGNDTTLCDVVNLTLSGPASADSYLWYNGTTMQDVTATGPGLYYLTITNTDDCAYTDSIIISVASNPTISLGADTTICYGEDFTLTPGPGFTSYVWSTSETTESIIIDDMGTYSVTVIDTNGCSASDTIQIDTVNCPNSVQYLNGIEYKIFPNPTSDFFTITSESNLAGSRLEIISTEGKQISVVEILGNSQQIDVSNLANGMYYLKLLSDNKSIGFKVSIHR